MTSQYIRSTFSSLREYLTPITHKSTFATTGEITPEEFVKAGDYLVYRFPTWQWSPADPSKSKDFLPPDKQFLVTRHVPSYVRASDYELPYDDDNNDNDNNNNKAESENQKSDSDNFLKDEDLLDHEGWSTTGSEPKVNINLIRTLTNDENNKDIDEGSIKEISEDEESDIQDIDELIDENAEDVEFYDTRKNDNNNDDDDDDVNHNIDNTNTKLLKTTKKRFYDLYITYSTSYRVPKMYLVGFDSDSVPLTPQQMFEDIASDYRHKTVTIEKAPFLNNTTSVSIHPCRHANVMKVLMKRASDAAKERIHDLETQKLMKNVAKLGLNSGDYNDTEDWEDLQSSSNDDDNDLDTGIRVDQYLIVFLKFISSVTPGIEHDYTMEAL
jgi:ubiquitin-like-conjugating enzyme ATG3